MKKLQLDLRAAFSQIKVGITVFGWGCLIVLVLQGFCWVTDAHAKKMHTVFFENTDYELNVYRSYGEEPGKTILLIGGIQGDEPGGFLSADLYADFSLYKGNLIVVPRANFQSIVLNRRQINDDMNRKFADDNRDNYETKVVSILKKLIAESDLLLNLHDGSGFYAEKWESDERNPMRFGQSIIADCESYVNTDTGKELQLGTMARGVIDEINKRIRNPKHYFRFNNHRTADKNSLHTEQRKSATYYALYTCGIPAFGVETSKSLPLEEKVRHHNLAINAFMEALGIIPESPGINLDPPELRYLIVSVNDSIPILVENQQTLYVRPDDTITISHIEANYERGLTADIIGIGTINDTRKPIRVTGPTRVVVRKDFMPCGSIYLAMSGGQVKFAHDVSVSSGTNGLSHLFFRLKINNDERVFRSDDHVKVIRGDTIEILDVITGLADPSNLVVNFKGFVGDRSNNTGEDRGYAIDTSRDLWNRYSVGQKGEIYPIVVSLDQKTVGQLYVDIEKPELGYVVVRTKDHQMHCFVPGQTAELPRDGAIRLVDIITNVNQNAGIRAFWAGPESGRRQLNVNDLIPSSHGQSQLENQTKGSYRMDIQRDDMLIGSVFFTFMSGDPS